MTEIRFPNHRNFTGIRKHLFEHALQVANSHVIKVMRATAGMLAEMDILDIHALHKSLIAEIVRTEISLKFYNARTAVEEKVSNKELYYLVVDEVCDDLNHYLKMPAEYEEFEQYRDQINGALKELAESIDKARKEWNR